MNDYLNEWSNGQRFYPEGVIPDVVIDPLPRYLTSGSLSVGGVYKAVLGTAFDRDHVLLFSLAPTNTGEGEPKATSRIALSGDKNQMFFVSHSRLRPT
jgi:hypothetical protein